jgi:hypothetical protein
MNKKLVRAFIVLMAVFMLTGCIDVLHYIGRNGDGEPMAVVKLTLEKAIFQWAASMGGSDMPTTNEEFEQEFDLSEEEVTEELPDGLEVVYSTVNSSTDFGFQLELTRRAGADDGEALPWLPQVAEDGSLRISLPEQDAEGATESEGEAFLASAKYRLIAAKSLCPENPRFAVLGSGEELDARLDVLELPEVYLVEFPLMLWLSSSEKLEVVAQAR